MYAVRIRFVFVPSVYSLACINTKMNRSPINAEVWPFRLERVSKELCLRLTTLSKCITLGGKHLRLER